MIPGVFGKQRGHAPRPGRRKRPRVERIVGTVACGTERTGGGMSFDLAVDDIGPVSLDADERRSLHTVERAIRIVPATSDRRVDLLVGRIMAGRWIDLREANPQPALTSEEDRQIRRVDLREVPEHIKQAPEPSRNWEIHTLPDGVLGFGI